MSNHHVITDDEDFQTTLSNAGPNKVVVVDFNATWCGPCQKIAPVFVQLAHKYPQALFLGVDVDVCRETAMAQGVSAMPTFIFYKNRRKIDTMRGANGVELEEKIRLHCGDGAEGAGAGIPGQPADISQYIEKKGCECLNEADETPFQDFLEGKGILKSDCDEQLILVYGFNQNIKLQGFRIKTTTKNGPKSLKFFINQPKTLDFDSAGSMTPVQEIELTEDDLSGEKTIELRFVKFQSVHNLQIFVAGNQCEDEVTQIDSLNLIGMPVNTTNMGEFKRVSGNKGESH
jgi:thiol-disulfide isomerase/thioredoxin